MTLYIGQNISTYKRPRDGDNVNDNIFWRQQVRDYAKLTQMEYIGPPRRRGRFLVGDGLCRNSPADLEN